MASGLSKRYMLSIKQGNAIKLFLPVCLIRSLPYLKSHKNRNLNIGIKVI